MKLIKINHIRCGEYDTTTYAWAPDEYTTTDIEKHLINAQQELIDAQLIFKKEAPPYVPMFPDYRNYDKNLTIAEIDKLHKEKYDAHQTYQDSKRKANSSFIYYLKEHGFKPLYDNNDVPDFDLNWGHHHGLNMDYAEKINDFKLTPGSEDNEY